LSPSDEGNDQRGKGAPEAEKKSATSSPEGGGSSASEGAVDVGPEDRADTPSPDDLDAEDLEEIGDAVADETSDESDQEDGPEDALEEPTPEDFAEGDISVGHVYCQTLGVSAAVLVDRYDDPDDDRDKLVDEYADLARQTDLDVYMDQWFEENWGTSEMSAGQGLAVGTCLFFAMVAMNNPAVVDGIAGEVDV